MNTPTGRIDVSQFPSVQAAFDALPRSGGVIHFPAGRYEIPQTVRLALSEGQHLFIAGDGRASVLINTSRDLAPLMQITGIVGSWWPNLKITVRDLTFEGSCDSGDALVIEYPNDTQVDSCFFFGHGGHAVRLGPHGTNVTIRDCWARDCRKGFRAEHIHHLTLHGNQTRSRNEGQRQLEHVYLDYDCREVRIVNNHLAYGHAEGIILDGTAQHVIAGNTIEGFTTGILARGVARDMVISSNYIHSPVGVRLVGVCDGFAINGNTFINNHDAAVRVEDADGSGGHSITGNVVRTSVYQGNGGIDLGDAGQCVVVGNVLDHVDGHGVVGGGHGHEIAANARR